MGTNRLTLASRKYINEQGMSEIMIPKVDWMVAADTLIIWFMSEHRFRFAVNPTVVAINVGMSQSHANRRMKFLTQAGLIEQVDDRGYYRISDLGQRYIIGECTLEELEAVNPMD